MESTKEKEHKELTPKGKKATTVNGSWYKKLTWENFGVPIAIVVLIILTGSLRPMFFRSENIFNILRQISALSLVAFAMTLILISGGIDLSPASTVALVSIVAALIIKSTNNVLLAVIAGLGTGIACGVLNGTLIGFLNLPPFIATLGTQSVLRGFALTITGGVPVMNLKSEGYLFLGSGNIGFVPFMSIIAIIGFIVTYILLYWTKFGIYTYAIGGNETVAKWAGVRVDIQKLLIYSYSGLLFGLSGLILGARVNSGQPYLGTGIELQAIAAACIGGTSTMGGKGTLIGTLFGVILIGILNNSLNLLEISSFVQEIIIGSVIVIAVLTSNFKKR